MKLFSLPDGAIDRKDRAQWVTPPFDLALAAPVVYWGEPVALIVTLFRSVPLVATILRQWQVQVEL